MQLKAKRGELPGNVDGIKTAELAYDASFDGFLETGVSPSGSPGKVAVDFTDSGGFASLGWKPDGKVRGQYTVTNVTVTEFIVSSICDVDGDGSKAHYRASALTNATLDATDTNTT